MDRPIESYLEDRDIMWLIRYYAQRITCAINDKSYEESDVRQDLHYNLLRRSRNYDPTKSSFKTFAGMVLRRYTDSIIKHHAAAKRHALGGMVYMDHEIDTDEGDVSFHERISPGDCHPGWPQHPPRHDHQDLAFDLRRTQQKLPPRLSQTADALRERKASEAADHLKIHRSVLYERRAEIRRHFERTGLQEYLQK